MNHHFKTGLLATYDSRPLYAVYIMVIRFADITTLRILYLYKPEQMADLKSTPDNTKTPDIPIIAEPALTYRISSEDVSNLKVGTPEKRWEINTSRNQEISPEIASTTVIAYLIPDFYKGYVTISP